MGRAGPDDAGIQEKNRLARVEDFRERCTMRSALAKNFHGNLTECQAHHAEGYPTPRTASKWVRDRGAAGFRQTFPPPS